MPKEIIARHVGQAQQFYQKYERYLPAAFFTGGFLFDIVTLSRIDSEFTLLQHLAYLLILTTMLTHWLIQVQRQWTFSPRWQWWERWRIHVLHFIFGSLLSSFTLFYFLSASISTSFVFLAVMAVFLVANEFEYFQRLGLAIKFALLALCWLSYAAYVVPTVLGTIGTAVFLLSMGIGVLPLLVVHKIAQRFLVMRPALILQIWRPAGVVVLVLLISYLLRLMPPVPLSVQYIGVYHTVAKTPENLYQLGYERPWWKFWQNGDQSFAAQPGDKVVVFFRLFSPTRFSDYVRLTWYLKEPRAGWTKQDSIPIRVAGGRDEGFRAYGEKRNYTSGQWRAVIETLDGREIGRISFELSAIETQPRELRYDFH